METKSKSMMRERFDHLIEVHDEADRYEDVRDELFGAFSDEQIDSALAVICPRCCQMIPSNDKVGQYIGAISRVASEHSSIDSIEICSTCGNLEGLEQLLFGEPKAARRWFLWKLSIEDISALVHHVTVHREVVAMLKWQEENPDGEFSDYEKATDGYFSSIDSIGRMSVIHAGGSDSESVED